MFAEKDKLNLLADWGVETMTKFYAYLRNPTKQARDEFYETGKKFFNPEDESLKNEKYNGLYDNGPEYYSGTSLVFDYPKLFKKVYKRMLQGQVDTNDFVLMVDVFSVIDEKENSPYPQYEKDIFVEHHKTDNGMIGIIYQ